MDDKVRDVVYLIVEQLKSYIDGDEDALLELTQILDSGRHDADIVNRAFEMIFRALEPYSREAFAPLDDSKRPSVRVPTGSEQALLPGPAINYLFRLSESGRVTPEQFEEIMDRAREMGPTLDTETKAEELATSVLIRWFDENHDVAVDSEGTPSVH
ncbi:MAG TPA: DUF494 family protein [Candidatus Eisenbacteria bacterium]|jgi:hypothetical protein